MAAQDKSHGLPNFEGSAGSPNMRVIVTIPAFQLLNRRALLFRSRVRSSSVAAQFQSMRRTEQPKVRGATPRLDLVGPQSQTHDLLPKRRRNGTSNISSNARRDKSH